LGGVPTGGETLRRLRDLTSRYGVVLIFDEVVTGFRVSPGGAQSHYRVLPDLTALAKVVAGGLPGALVTGRSDIFSSMDFGGDDEKTVDPAVPHQGTFNASPLSAAAGVTALKLLKDGAAIATANETAAKIRDGMNAVLRKLGASWCVYGEFSAVHIFTNPHRESITPRDILDGRVYWKTLKSGATPELVHKIRLGFLCQGVDVNGWPGGQTSAVHDSDDVDRTVVAFEEVLKQLAEEGDLD
jgi:glutamate-1-semialdehyde 2,1-aminomutase